MACLYKNNLSAKGMIIFLILVFGLTRNVNAANGIMAPRTNNPSCKTLRSMARVYMAYGDYAKAQPLLERALKQAADNNVSDKELCSCLIDAAYVYLGLGRLSEAEQMCSLGLQLQEKVYFRNHPYVAYTLRNLASIYTEQGRFQQAMTVMDRAMAIILESHTENDQTLAPFHVDIAKILVAQGRLQEAENYYRQALELINQSYGPDHLYTAGVLGEVARLYTLQERYLEAEPLIAKAQAAQEKIYGSDHHMLIPTWLTRAAVYQAKGQLIQSEEMIQMAFSTVEKKGNSQAISKVRQRVAKIRASRKTVFETVAKAVN